MTNKHTDTKYVDLRPVARDDRDLIGAVSRWIPSTKTALEAAPKPFSALFDKLTHWFLKTLPASPLNPKTWRGLPPKSLIPKDRDVGGGGHHQQLVNNPRVTRKKDQPAASEGFTES
jgi:hypothetical protein